MSQRPLLVALAAASCLATAACGDPEPPPGGGGSSAPTTAPATTPPATPAPPRPAPASTVPGAVPSYQVTTILLAYKTPRLPEAKRTREETRALAESLVRRIREGESMERLLLAHTDDRDEAGEPFNGGTYSLLAEGDPADSRLVALAARTPVGQVAPDLFDSGTAIVILRRDL